MKWPLHICVICFWIGHLQSQILPEFNRSRGKNITMPDISATDLRTAFSQILDLKPFSSGCTKGGSDAVDQASLRLQLTKRLSNLSLPVFRSGLVYEKATEFLTKQYNLSNDQATYGLETIDLSPVEESARVRTCHAITNIDCSKLDKRFRTEDGACNNINHPTWGKAYACFESFLDPIYADGIMLPKLSQSGSKLPSARKVSQMFHLDLDRPDLQSSLMVMQFGQFVSHDINATPDLAPLDGTPVNCCGKKTSEAQCHPIEVPKEDPFYGPLNQTCLNFVRTAPCNDKCKLGARRQINQQTAFVDGSHIYGRTEKESRSLRSMKQGKLLSQQTKVGELLPTSFTPEGDQCSFPEQKKLCFQAGDSRVNQHIGITTMHTLFLRQHNRLAEKLLKVKPNATDEEVYQTVRRIVGAQLQAITYQELLPVILGPDYMSFFKLNTAATGYTKYDPNLNPTLFTEFTTTAFRFGHSMIQNEFLLADKNGQTSGNVSLNERFSNPFEIYDGDFDKLIMGLTTHTSQSFDRHVVDGVRQNLYKAPKDLYGLDLPAFNIQRSRDHGMPSYPAFVHSCFNRSIESFEQLTEFISQKNLALLENIYTRVGDIDWFTGGLAEKLLPNSTLGPTFACLIGLQFQNLKYGDRYYFEHGHQEGSLTKQQLESILETSLAEIICLNTEAQSIARNVFAPPESKSSRIQCNAAKDISAQIWL